MLLTIDIGNSNINVGGYKGPNRLFVARVRTDSSRTEYEYAVTIKALLELYGYNVDRIEGAIISSVVPPLTPILRSALRLIREMRVLVVGPGMKTGLNIRIDNPGQLGADLLATAIGAMDKYPLPAIVVDLGTATKLMVVDQSRSFLGGAIMPGVMIALEALAARTAQLPQISLDDPVQNPIGANTIDCMRSGTILGTASMIDGMVARYQEVLGCETSVVACGGLVNAVVPYCNCKLTIDEHLLMDGLRVLFEKNT